MKQREYFLYAKKIKITTLFNNSSPLHPGAILESIHWMQTAYAVLCQPHHTDTFSMFIYALIWTAYPCGVATNCWVKSLFLFSLHTKVILSLHSIQIEPLIADGLFWRCLSYFSGPWQCYLLGSQWDSHKPPGFHPKYLKMCSEDEQSFYGYDMGVSD